MTERSAVLQALAEFDQLGRDGFLDKYGYGTAKSYYLLHEGRLYDSKAIIGVAYGYQFPEDGPLLNSDFSGGAIQVQPVLERLGFEVEAPPPPGGDPWADAELEFFGGLLELRTTTLSDGRPTPHKPLVVLGALSMYRQGADRLIGFANLADRVSPLLSRLAPTESAPNVAEPFWRLQSDLIWEVTGVDDEFSDAGSPPSATALTAAGASGGVMLEYFEPLLGEDHWLGRTTQILAGTYFPEDADWLLDELDLTSNRGRLWWVNQGFNYDRERQEQYLRAPQKNRAGVAIGYHTAVADLRPGDGIIHYANGQIRSVSRVTDWPKTTTFTDSSDEDWEREAFRCETTYFDLDDPISLIEIQDRTPEAGPFTESGSVIQGYLFPLSKEFADSIVEQFADRWPANSPFSSGSRWAEYVYWARQLLEDPGFDLEEGERNYKLRVGEQVRAAQSAVQSSDPEWVGVFKRAFGGENNLTSWHVHPKVIHWAEEQPAEAHRFLDALWSVQSDPLAAMRSAAELLPKDIVSGPGTRTSILSYLLLVIDGQTYPFYKPQAFTEAYRLVGFPFDNIDEDEASTYQLALSFLDRFMAEAERRGLSLRDRLDAQSLTWTLMKYEPPASWSEEKSARFLAWREPGPPMPPDPLKALADELLLDVDFFHELQVLLDDKRQAIFYGPPGTGKTYVAEKFARALAGADNRVQIVQFHPSYAYEDFVEGYRPHETEDGQPGFKLMPGPLKRIATSALEDPDNLYVLIIDEINRGNVAKVLGELYYLLEYRGNEIRLQYSDEPFTLPDNLWIIGTMNTADRSIALVDAALRRRFRFVAFFPDEPPVEDLLRRWLVEKHGSMEWVADVVDQANSELQDRHLAIGPSYFMREDLDEEWVSRIWKHSVIPYIQEQYFGEEDQVARFELAKLRNRSAGVIQETVLEDMSEQPQAEGNEDDRTQGV